MKKSILKIVHESAKGLHNIGLLSVKSMSTFDAICLTVVEKNNHDQIKQRQLKK